MQFEQLKRREFIALLGGAAAWPLAARAEQPEMPVIGLLSLASLDPYAHPMTAFHAGLQETGYIEGQNVTIEYRWADGRYDLLPSLAAELVRRSVTVLAAIGGTRVGRAAMAATATIPIVFLSGADPIKVGLVHSLSRQGGNATGVHLLTGALDPKRLGLLRELAPEATLVGVLLNPNVEDFQFRVADVQEAARTVGLQIHVLRATTDPEIDAAFAALSGIRAGALVVSSNAFFRTRREQIVALAARNAIPAIYDGREYAAAGGLVSYGTSLAHGYRQAGIYTARILKGAKPRRPAGVSVDQIRVRHQHEDRQGAGRQNLRQSALARRRSDRVNHDNRVVCCSA
jgi:putative tryptophan/tyrosine transport system substrate-binding protein